MIRAAKELLICLFPDKFPNWNKVTMTIEVVQGTRPVSLHAADESADRLTPFSDEPECTLTKDELVALFNADPHSHQYAGKRRRPRTRFG